MFIIGFRYYTGADWAIYLNVWEQGVSYGSRMEYGYLLLNSAFRRITDNYYIMQFAITAFILITAYKMYKKNTDYSLLAFSLFIFLFFLEPLMSQTRQCIALAFVVLSLKYIFERRLIWFLLMIFFAYWFHSSAIIALPLYFLTKNYNKWLLFSLVLITALGIISQQAIVAVLEIAQRFLPANVVSTIAAYTVNIDEANMQGAETRTGLFALFRNVLVVTVLLLTNPKDSKMRFFINALVVGTILINLSSIVVIINRLSFYYMVFGVIGYTYLFSEQIKTRASYISIVYAICLLSFLSFPMIRAFTSTEPSVLNDRPSNYQLVPYYNFFFHPEGASGRRDWWQQ